MSEDMITYDDQWKMAKDFIKYNPGSRHRRRLINKELSKSRFSSLLEVGCGPGENLKAIHRVYSNNIYYYGIDISEYVIEKNKEKIPFANFNQLDIQEKNIDEKFDVILFSEVIEHLSNPRKAMKNIKSMLKRDGRVLITCPKGKLYRTELYWGHIKHYTYADFQELAKTFELKIESYYEWGFPFFNAQKRAINIHASWAMKHFGLKPYNKIQKLVSNLLYGLHFLNIKKRGVQIVCLMKNDMIQ